MIDFEFDPGHGGRDPGAGGPRGCEEKNFALDIAKRAKGYTESQGFTVGMTRTTDVFVELDERAAIANNAAARYFIAFHLNAAAIGSVDGLETFSLNQGTEGEKLAATLLSELLIVMKINNRGVKQANFAVLRETNMPATLLEMGFISNPDQEVKMMNDDYRDAIAKAVAKGLTRFVGKVWTEKVAAPAPKPAAPSGNQEVRDLQDALNAAGLRDAQGRALIVDGIPGPNTKYAAKRVVLKVTLSDQEKLRFKLVVKWFQRQLLKKGFALPRYGADGDYGDETAKAAKAWQKSEGLTQDAHIGPQSWEELI